MIFLKYSGGFHNLQEKLIVFSLQIMFKRKLAWINIVSQTMNADIITFEIGHILVSLW